MNVLNRDRGSCYSYDPDSIYEQEYRALQQDFPDMNRDMADELHQVEAQAVNAQHQTKADWDTKISIEKIRIEACVKSFKDEEDRALEKYEADVLEVERLRGKELQRLRQSIPLPQRPAVDPPPQRPHRAGVTQVMARPSPNQVSQIQARAILNWLVEHGWAQKQDQGVDFLEALRKAPMPDCIRNASDRWILTLYTELRSTPTRAWGELVPVIAQLLQARKAGTFGAEPRMWSTYARYAQKLLTPSILNWHWIRGLLPAKTPAR